MIEKRLFDHFNDKFTENLPASKTQQEAFEKTNQQLGFIAYSSFHSFSVLRKKKKRK